MTKTRFHHSALALSIALASGSVMGVDYSSSNWTGGDSTSESGNDNLATGDTLTIEMGDTLDTTGTGDDGIADGSDGYIIRVYGSVIGDSDGVDVDNTEDSEVSIYSDGSVNGGADGIYASDALNLKINVFGTVTGGDEGIDLDDETTGTEVNVYSGGVVQSTGGGNDDGIWMAGGNTVNVFQGGKVISASSDAIEIDDDPGLGGSIINISGLLQGGDNAIYIQEGTSNVINIRENARLIGGLTTDDAGNTLKFDVGSAMSYVFDTTGDWSLEDLDSRAVVEGSAMAAGIGNAETADELQYLRLSQIKQSLVNRADRYAIVDGERQAWIDPFYFNSKRDASSTDATIEDYDTEGYGLTVGLPIFLKGLDADVILGIQETALDIDNDTQNIDVTSLRAGLYSPNLLTKDSIRVSGKALIGYNEHDMDRQVLVNSNTTTGITTYTADYDSWEATVGLEAEHRQPLGTGATTLTASLGADFIYEAIESYDETANFHWESRDLLQGVADASVGLHHVYSNGMKTYAIASIQARDVLDGKATDYAINGTAVNFRGGDFNDTIIQLNSGVIRQVKENLQLRLNINAAKSDSDVSTYAALAHMNWKF